MVYWGGFQIVVAAVAGNRLGCNKSWVKQSAARHDRHAHACFAAAQGCLTPVTCLHVHMMSVQKKKTNVWSTVPSVFLDKIKWVPSSKTTCCQPTCLVLVVRKADMSCHIQNAWKKLIPHVLLLEIERERDSERDYKLWSCLMKAALVARNQRNTCQYYPVFCQAFRAALSHFSACVQGLEIFQIHPSNVHLYFVLPLICGQ